MENWDGSYLSVPDKNGNIQPVKGADERRRIDGTAALLDGYVVLKNKMDEYESLI